MACKIYTENTVILDIEGTTTPIDFVHVTLFKYARDNLTEFLLKNNKGNALEQILLEMVEYSKITERSELISDEQIVKCIENLIEKDSKLGALKKLEGLIWQEGYESGKLKSEIYDDVPESLKRWKKSGKKIYIYSSGSVLAQKLLFRYSIFGDLTGYIDGYFDTEIGSKKEIESYRNISRNLEVLPERITFITDSEEEMKSARNAGINSFLIKRNYNESDDKQVDFIVDFKSLC